MNPSSKGAERRKRPLRYPLHLARRLTGRPSPVKATDSTLQVEAPGNTGNAPETSTNRRCSFRDFVVKDILRKDKCGNEPILLSEADQREIAKRMNEDYTETLLLFDLMEDDLDARLTGAKHILDELVEILGYSSRNFSSDQCWVVQQSILELVADYVLPRTTLEFRGMSSFDTVQSRKEAAKIITWIDSFLSAISSTCSHLTLPPLFVQDLRVGVDQYIDMAVKREMKQFVKRSLHIYKQRDVRVDAEGRAVTSCPEMVAFMYEQQLTVAKEMLPPTYIESVLVACHTELACLVGEVMVMIDKAEERGMERKVYCAIINDVCRFLELCDERNRATLIHPQCVEVGDALASNLTHFTLFVVDRLCKRIILDSTPQGPLQVGSPSWESGEPVVESALESLQQFFMECQQWLCQQWLTSKILKHTMDLLLYEMVSSFFVNTMSRRLHSTDKAASSMRRDASLFELCFEQYLKVHGFYSQEELEARVQILKSMATLISSERTVGAKKQAIRVLMSRLDCEGERSLAVWHLTGLRQPFDRIEFENLLDMIEKVMDTIRDDEQEILYRIPDLSDSKFLLPHVLQRESKIVRTKETITDQVSAGVMRCALGTSLLTPTGLLASLTAVRLKDSVSEVVATGKQSRGASDDSYRFGDITRGLAKSVYETVQSGKASRGAPANGNYVFGDLTRGLVSSFRSRPAERRRHAAGSTAAVDRYGGVVGSSIGAVAGLSVLGPAGMVAGGVAGQVAGQSLFGSCKKVSEDEEKELGSSII